MPSAVMSKGAWYAARSRLALGMRCMLLSIKGASCAE